MNRLDDMYKLSVAPKPFNSYNKHFLSRMEHIVRIPEGEFMMGTEREMYPGTDIQMPHSFRPPHAIEIRSFYLDDAPFVYPDDPKNNLPAVDMTWDAAQLLAGINNGRLPTEAEWEYAARAGSTTDYPWGDEASEEHASWNRFDKEQLLMAIRSFKPNDFGLYDMHGNVWEWVADIFEENTYAEHHKMGIVLNPYIGPTYTGDGDSANPKNLRVRRGGASNIAEPFRMTSYNRGVFFQGNTAPNIGFRIAYDISDKDFKTLSDIVIAADRSAKPMTPDGGGLQINEIYLDSTKKIELELIGACKICPNVEASFSAAKERLEAELPRTLKNTFTYELHKTT